MNRRASAMALMAIFGWNSALWAQDPARGQSPDTQLKDAGIKAPITAPTARSAGGSATSEVGAEAPSERQIHGVVRDYLKSNTHKGVVKLSVREGETPKELELKFVEFHSPASKLPDGTYVACSEFKTADKDKASGKRGRYDIDFHLVLDANGRLAVQPEKTAIHKVNGNKPQEKS